MCVGSPKLPEDHITYAPWFLSREKCTCTDSPLDAMVSNRDIFLFSLLKRHIRNVKNNRQKGENKKWITEIVLMQ